MALLARAYVRSQRWDRQHLAVLLAASLIPWATNIVTLSPLEPLPGFDLTPLGFGVSALLLGWALMRYGLLERLPIPYQVVFENLQDAAVVGDHRGYVVDLNQAAQHLFGVHPATVLGRPLAFLAPQLAFGVNETHEYRWPSSDPEVPGESIYSVSTTGLPGNRELLITLRDITASHRANGALHRRGRVLEAVDFAAEQFLKAALWEDVMDQVLARLGQAAGVGRTALAGNEMRDGELGFRELHAWAAPDWEMEWLSPATTYQRVGLPRWPQAFREGQAVLGRAEELPEDERAVLAARGVEAVAALPIFQAGHWWGFLICESRADDEVHFELVIDALKTAVSTLEAVMERSQAEANRMRSAHFQQSLLELTRELLQQEVTPSFYQTILERAIDAVPGAEAGSLLLRGEDSRFRFVAAVGSDLELLAGITVRDDELVGGGEDASSYLLHEAYDPSAYRLDADTRRALETAAAQTGIAATLVVPIVLESELVASFRLENYQSREVFDAETRRMAEAFGAQIGALLQRARLQARTTQAASANALLADIERLLLVSDRLETFFPLLAKLILEERTFGVHQMGVFRLRGDRFQVEIFEDGGRRNRDLERWLEVHGLLSTDRKDGFEEVIRDYSTRYVADMHSYPGWVPNDDNPMRALFDVPVALDGNLWGVIEFSSRTLGGLSEGVREVLGQIGSSIELALMKQADRERQALQIAKMQAVVETSELLRGLISRQQVVQHSLEAILEMTRSDQCNLLLYDADEGVLKVVGSLRRSQEWRAQRVGDELAQGEGLSWQVFEAGRTLRFRDENGLGQVADQQEAGKPIAFVGTPTRNQEGEVVGVLTASLDDPAAAFRADDIGFLEAIAQACSSALLRLTLLEKSQNQAIEYRRLYTSAERQAQELALLDRVRTAVARELELDELFYSTVESISEILGYGLVSAYWLEGDELVLQSQVGYDRVVERLPIGEGIMGRAVRTMAPILVPDVRRDPDQASVHEGVVSQVAVPIIANEGVVGVIDIASREVDLDENDLRVMMRLSEQVGAAAERARLYGVVRDREQRFRLLAENMSDMVCLHEPDGRFAYVSPSCLGVLGYSPEALLDRDFVDLVHPEDRKLLGDRLFQQRVAEDSASQAIYRIRHAEGYYVWFETTAQPIIEQGLLTGLVTASRDITERHMIEEKLVQGALYDDLTGLPNRALLMDRLAQALERRVRTESRFAVLFLDLDRFKIINDSLGHAAGDELLKAIGERLKTCVRTIDTVARLGGDEFCLLLEDLHGQEEATETATRIQRALTQPFTVDEHDIFTSASIGIAFSSSHYGEPQELLRDADIAMYRAKNAGKARHAVFDHAMHDQAVNLMKLETDLHRAVERGELFLEYQPIVHLETGEMAGFEALVRWRHPERGLIEPSDFIPMAEEAGQVLSLDRWVLREACRRTAEWQRTFDPGRPLMVSVNFSAMHFTLGDGAEALVKTVLEAGLPPSQLKLEITEGALIDNSSQAVEMLEALRREGIVVQVDDFGTGYSSLSYLHRLPIDSLKIDRSFVQGIEQDGQNLEIVTTIVNLAHSLRIDVVAEGIENAEQLQLLLDLSCEYGQGFHFAKPLSPEEVERRFLHPVSRT